LWQVAKLAQGNPTGAISTPARQFARAPIQTQNRYVGERSGNRIPEFRLPTRVSPDTACPERRHDNCRHNNEEALTSEKGRHAIDKGRRMREPPWLRWLEFPDAHGRRGRETRRAAQVECPRPNPGGNSKGTRIIDVASNIRTFAFTLKSPANWECQEKVFFPSAVLRTTPDSPPPHLFFTLPSTEESPLPRRCGRWRPNRPVIFSKCPGHRIARWRRTRRRLVRAGANRR